MPMPRAFRRVGRAVNPVALPLARRLPPLAVVEHVGRRSGRPYRTPVQAFRTESGWVVALAYGDDVDWVRNLLAAGGGHLVRGGRRYRLTDPRRLRGAPGKRLLPWWSRALMTLVRVGGYVTFDAAEVAPETPAATTTA
ncbi:nitroreductase family deazaflavin-dependent oxidoreductase [Spirillospora sp. NPDC052242]